MKWQNLIYGLNRHFAVKHTKIKPHIVAQPVKLVSYTDDVI